MPSAARPALVGLAVALALAVALGVASRAVGASFPLIAVAIPVVIGLTVAGAMSRLAGNRGERRLEGAERDAALALVPPPGAALLVLTREGFAGRALGIDVAVDGRPAVQLRSPRGAVLPVARGPHTVSATIPNREAGPPAEPLRVELAPGDVAFLTVRFVTGTARNTAVVALTQDAARQRTTLASLPLVAPRPDWGAVSA